MNKWLDKYQDGGIIKKVDSILQANRKKLGWINRLYEKDGENIQIPGVKGTSTHYMAQYDNYAVPLITKGEEGKLQYIENPDTTYIKKHGIKFSDDKKALEFSQNYKKGTGVLPKFQGGGIIKDNRGQWEHPGEITEIDSNQITMKGVLEPLIGISNTGHIQYMEPNKNYKFNGKKVTEIPLNKINKWLSKYE